MKLLMEDGSGILLEDGTSFLLWADAAAASRPGSVGVMW